MNDCGAGSKRRAIESQAQILLDIFMRVRSFSPPTLSLRGCFRPRTAFVVVGIIGLALVIADALGWMPRTGGDGLAARLSSSVTSPEEDAGFLANGSILSTVDADRDTLGVDRDVVEVRPVPPTPTPRTHQVREGESLLEISANYGVEVELIAEANGLWDPNRLRVGQVLLIPHWGYAVRPAVAESSGEMKLWWPAQGEITTDFGEEESYYLGGAHTGIDIAANVGVPVRAAADGKVVVAWKRPDNVGWHIVLDHGNGYSTLYGHLSKFFVDEGDVVKRGEVIGSAGNTGFSLGPHLHFEVRKWGTLQNPLNYLPP